MIALKTPSAIELNEGQAMQSPTRLCHGHLVEYWVDDGRGGTILYGIVIAAGPKTARVMWESGNSNRIKQDTHLVAPARLQDLAREAVSKVAPIGGSQPEPQSGPPDVPVAQGTARRQGATPDQ
jgi:hypothetical protein